MTSNDDRRYLLRLISEGEHQQQDFKYKVQDAVKLARSVSAFANTDGGRLLIGVRDDGHLSGVRSEEEIYMMHQAAYRYCRPEASIRFDTYRVAAEHHPAGGTRGSALRTIVVATVPRSDRRPVMALDADGRQRAYVRIADENIVASPVHLAIWRDELAAHGATFTYGDDERRLMAAMSTDEAVTLNQVVRRSRLPRHKVILLLSRMVRYGLVAMHHAATQFLFQLIG